MNQKIVKIIKQNMWSSISRAKFDLSNIKISSINDGRIFNFKDLYEANSVAHKLVILLREKYLKDPESVPSEKKELENYLNAWIAELSFNDAFSMLNRKAKHLNKRSDRELLKECQEAINQLRKCGEGYVNTSSSYEYMLKGLK